MTRPARGWAASPLRLALAVASLLVVAGCIPNVSLPDTCNQAAVSFAATLADEGLEPPTFDACRGQHLTLAITAEQDGILHLHGYDDLLGAREVRAGQTIDLEFEATHVGQFPITLHTLDGQDAGTVGTLIVHDA